MGTPNQRRIPAESLTTFATLIAALLAPLTFAAEIPILSGETKIPLGAKQEFTVPAIPAASSRRAKLEILARMDAPGLGGSMFFLSLKLNGKEIQARKTRLASRLLNRPLTSPITPSLDGSWFGASGGWRILYSPDFEAAKKQTFYVDDPYRLVLDVTDLVSTTEPNRLEIRNTATPALAAKVNAPMDLVVARATLSTKPGESSMAQGAPPRPHLINRGEPGAGPAPYRGEVLPEDGFALSMGGNRFVFQTSMNRSDSTLHRDIRFTPRRVEITDEITNNHPDRDLGLLVQHRVGLADFPDADVRLAGNNDPAVDRSYAPANPSVHIALKGAALGFLCEDDVFRNQATLVFDPKTQSAGLETDKLYLPAGGKAVLRWSVYPVASEDYYDFVNLVRQDWGANFTVEGAWCFFGPDQILAMPLSQLTERLNRLGVNFACSWGGWVDHKHDRKRIGFGAEVIEDPWSDYRRRLKEAIAKFHEAKPGLKALVYYDSQRDTHKNAGELFPDSRLTGPDGKHGWTDWGKVYSDTWSMFATLDNQFGKAMLRTADSYLSEMGADGLYWDEMENVAFGQPLLTFSQPDGHSCLLDPKTHEIRQQIGITTLLGESHRLAVIDRVRLKGGTLMGNGPAHTRKLLQTHVPRMVEIQHNDTLAYEGHLGSPLGYQSGRPDFGAITRALSMAMLPVGTRLDYEYEITAHLFPFTPIELHSGYLLGRERIITIHSGSYGWPGEEVPCALSCFDSRGKLRDTIRAVAGPGSKRLKVDLQPGEVAVLERGSR